jgi:hypothetical protein
VGISGWTGGSGGGETGSSPIRSGGPGGVGSADRIAWKKCRVEGGEGGGSMSGEGKGDASGDEGGESRLGKGEEQISLHSVGDGEGSRRSSASFLRFLGFFTGGGAFPGDITGSAGCGAWTAVEAAAGVKPEPEHPAQRWRLCRAFNGGGAFRQRRRTRLALERCTIGIEFGALQHR